ncbi:hypothetical protein G9A89_006877 [Geosiphon pyriformis]|nr:hypothetical protein G9A89_006877 [Geosiphon pyriformis]
MKKTIKVSGSEGGFKAVASRKKKKGDVLKESINNNGVAAEAPGVHLWGSETDNTTKFKSINMEEECLVEETSVNYSENNTFVGGNPDQTPKNLCIKTKKVLRKPLGVIDYNTVDAEDNVLDDSFLFLPSFPIKLSIQVSVYKSFALDINLVAIAGKSFQEKLSFIRKIFSNMNDFGGVFTSSKFGGIICVTFTSEKTMLTAGKLANDHSIVVNTDLKHPNNNCMNWAIVIKEIPVRTSVKAVHAAVSEFGLIKSIKMQLADLLASNWSILIGKDTVHMVRANVDKQMWDSKDEFRMLLYTLSIRTNAHNFWDFIGSVDRKTCVIGRNSISYAYTHCATVCFGSESDLVSAMAATPVIKGIGLH